MQNAYLFNSLHALLTLPYGSHYKEYPKWNDVSGENKDIKVNKDGDTLADEFFSHFVNAATKK